MIPRTPLLAISLGLAVAVATFAPGRSATAQEFGTIKGRLVWGGATRPDAPLQVKKGDPNAKDAAVCAANDIPNEDYVVGADGGVANGFAYVVNPKGSNPQAESDLLAKAPTVVIDQKGCRFVPHAVAMHKGQTLQFKSSDAVGHNIRYTGFNIGGGNSMLSPNMTMDVKFVTSEKNPVELKCDIHPWMTGYFMVLDHPFFAVTKADGTFEITGVPAGKQRVIVRQEKVGFITPGARQGVEVEVRPGETTDMGDIKLMPKK